MAEFTDDDVTRLTDLMRPEFGICGAATLARRLLEQGVTLPPSPPDPAVGCGRKRCQRFGHRFEDGKRWMTVPADWWNPQCIRWGCKARKYDAKVQEAQS